MPIYKVTVKFKGHVYGWGETYYAEYADHDGMRAALAAFVPLRVALLGGVTTINDPYLSSTRFSQVDRTGDSHPQRYLRTQGANPDPIGPAENPNLCVLIECNAGGDYRRQLYLRGNPDHIYQNMEFWPVEKWIQAFNAFDNFLITRQWGIYAVNKPAAPLIIGSIGAPAPPNAALTTTAPHGVTVGKTFRIISAPGVTGARGIHTALEVPNDTSILFQALISGAYRGGGTMYPRIHQLKRFTQVDIVGVTHRDTGSPTDRPVGRRRRRARA